MKNKTFASILCIAALSIAVVGCKTATSALLTPQPQYSTVSTPVITTNTVIQQLPGTTNTVLVPVLVTNLVEHTVTNIVYVPSAGASNALAIGAQVAPLLPPPAGEIATGVLALLSAGLGLFARVQTKKANAASDKASGINDILTATIAGVEAAGNTLVKTSIQNAAAAAGVQDQLDPIVQAVTKTMPSQVIASTAPKT